MIQKIRYLLGLKEEKELSNEEEVKNLKNEVLNEEEK